jgi:hypothetical protein
VAELQEQRSGGSKPTQNTVSGVTIFGVVLLVGLLLGAVGVAIKLRLRGGGGGGGGDGGAGAGCGGGMGNLCFRTEGNGGSSATSYNQCYNQHYTGGNAAREEAVALAMVSSPSAAAGSVGGDDRSMHLRPALAPKPSPALVGEVATAATGERAPPARRPPPRSAPPYRTGAPRLPPTADKPQLAPKPKPRLQLLQLAAASQPHRPPLEEAEPTNTREDGGVGVAGCQGWVKLQSESGEPYFWNERTDVTQWMAPSPDHTKRRGSSSAV